MGTVPEVAGNPIPGPDPGLESTPLVWTLSGEEEKRRGGEIDNLPIGPGGAAHTRPEIDDETRPRRNSYPETAGIIILAEEDGEWGHRNGGVLGSIRRATTRESASHVWLYSGGASARIEELGRL